MLVIITPGNFNEPQNTQLAPREWATYHVPKMHALAIRRQQFYLKATANTP
jgi:hypothetical protein